MNLKFVGYFTMLYQLKGYVQWLLQRLLPKWHHHLHLVRDSAGPIIPAKRNSLIPRKRRYQNMVQSSFKAGLWS